MTPEMTVIRLPEAAQIAESWLKKTIDPIALIGGAQLSILPDKRIAWQLSIVIHRAGQEPIGRIGVVFIDAQTGNILWRERSLACWHDRAKMNMFLSDDEMQHEARELIGEILKSEVNHDA